MGVLKTITDEYFGDTMRGEDKIPIDDLDVEIVYFKDNNGVEHRHGYRVKDGDPNKMGKTLKTLIERAIEVRGTECSLNDIDVSNIKQMCYKKETNIYYGVFYNSSFNGDISGWNVSNVENMSKMFQEATSFNQPLNKWDVSSVKDMRCMFYCAKSFNQDISGWDISSVRDMRYMFRDAKSFNQPLNKWDVSSVRDMAFMFSYDEFFNQPLDKWNVSSVENMYGMFHGATSFNQDISGWKVSNVKDMNLMFDYTPLEKNNKLPKWYTK